MSKEVRTVHEMLQRKISHRKDFLNSHSASADKIRGELETYEVVEVWSASCFGQVKNALRRGDTQAAMAALEEFGTLMTEEWNTNAPLANAGVVRASGVLSALDEIEPLVKEAYETIKRGKGDELI